MNQDDSIIQLHAKIDEMSEFLDLEEFVKGDKNSLKQVRTYYRLCGWAYKRFHSKEGFVHFGISQGDTYSPKDLYYLPDTVSKYIKKGDTVMELGFGQAANIVYLAKKHPDAKFIGVDLGPFKEKNPPQNITTYRQDYSSLPQLADNSVDVIYAFETIVHNTDKEKICREATRVLKPGGVMIIYDFALSDELSTFDPKTQLAVALISKGGASAMIESVDALNKHYTCGGLTLENVTNYSKNTLPDVKRMQKLTHRVIRRRKFAKAAFKLVPMPIMFNVIVGYLGYDAVKADVVTYQEWILKKP